MRASNPRWDHDVAVIGAGPAGSAAAASLARTGVRVLLLDRADFPRFHIGESLLPFSNPIFTELGVRDEIEACGFVRKRGATFLSEDGKQRCRIDFSCAKDVPEPATWNVSRAELDHVLCRHAVRSGVDLVMPARAGGVRIEHDAVELEYVDANGATHCVRAGLLLDASGRGGFLARQFDLRVPDAALRKVALFAHFRGALLGTEADEGDIRVITRGERGWFWIIPLAADRCSVGVVFDHDEVVRRPGETAEETLDRCIACAPIVADHLPDRERIGPAVWEGDFSYSTRAHAGERWMLLGDAGSFIDPVFSSGVLLALRSALDASRAVTLALSNGGALDRRTVRWYKRQHERRYRFFRRLVMMFYRPASRDILFHPESWPAGTQALVSALSGNDRPSLSVRMRQEALFLMMSARDLVPSRARTERSAGRTGSLGSAGSNEE